MSEQFEGRDRGPSPPEGGEGRARLDEVPALAARGISKSFEHTRALDAVDLTINRGEVVALVGQNGSGKSTLVKILSGYHEPEPGGELSIDGVDVPLPVPPGKASEIGLSFVYQDLGLSGGMTVLENLNLSTRVRHGLGAWSPIWWRRERREARSVLKRYQVSLHLDTRARDLAPVDQARLAIVRSAHDLHQFQMTSGGHSSILVLDEPTVFLPEGDVRFLFDLIRTIISLGGSVLFISHDLTAIREIADRTVVLRDGRKVTEVLRGEFDEDELVNLIVGAVTKRRSTPAGEPDPSGEAASRLADQEIGQAASEPSTAAALLRGEGAIRIDGLKGGRLRELSLSLGAGEIVGIAGLIGSGAEDVPYLLFGSLSATAGTLELGGDTLSIPRITPSQAVQRRLALIPADRKQFGLGLGLTVWENMVMLIQDDYYRRGVFHRDELIEVGEQGVVDFGIRPPRADVRASALSGGNQQKLLLAKWLLAKPRLLIAHEPTQGVDVGARRDIYRLVRRAAATESMAVVWVSTDFAELEEVCHRVVIVSRGRQSDELQGVEMTEDSISAAVLRRLEEVG
ncbi:MAG: ATP-binding cassette domain-containing protein [Acidimicrobiales bacterium]